MLNSFSFLSPSDCRLERCNLVVPGAPDGSCRSTSQFVRADENTDHQPDLLIPVLLTKFLLELQLEVNR